MQYKTITLELIQDRPELHQQLTSSRTLLSTVNQLAGLLRAVHLTTIEQLRSTRPQVSPQQLSSEAMELALQQLEEALALPSQPDEAFSLDLAIAYLRRHTPPE
jgi:hypothetical protein